MNPKPLIIFSCYHKSGTTLLRNFIIDYSQKHNLKWKESHFENLCPEDLAAIDIWFDPWSTALVHKNYSHLGCRNLTKELKAK